MLHPFWYELLKHKFTVLAFVCAAAVSILAGTVFSPYWVWTVPLIILILAVGAFAAMRAIREANPPAPRETGGAGPVAGGVPLPPQVFVPREDKMVEARKMLGVDAPAQAPVPQVALVGIPGAGKTTLASALAHDTALHEHFSGGVLWANLGLHPRLDVQLSRWAARLRVDLSAEPDIANRIAILQQKLEGRPVLVVLDDVWRWEDTTVLRQILYSGSALLITTRDRNIGAPSDLCYISVGELDPAAASQLLAALCPAVAALDPAALERIAQKVGYLPLALKLVGGFLAQRRHDDSRRDALAALNQATQWLGLTDQERQLTLDQVIGLSVDVLPRPARAAFAALAPFAPKPASFDSPAARAVDGLDDAAVDLLLARNLLENAGGDRLAIHQTIAEAAKRRAHQSEQRPLARLRRFARRPAQAGLLAWQRQHAQYYLDLMKSNPEDWQLITREWPQIDQAWRWVSSTGDEQRVLAYIYAASLYHERQGLWEVKLAWCQLGLNLVRAAKDLSAEASMLMNIGVIYNALGEKQQALRYFEQALPLARAVGDRDGEAATLNIIGEVYNALGEQQQALGYYEQALPLRRAVGDRFGERITLFNMAMIYTGQGNYAEAVRLLEQAVAIDQAVHHPNLASDTATLEQVRAKLAAQHPKA